MPVLETANIIWKYPGFREVRLRGASNMAYFFRYIIYYLELKRGLLFNKNGEHLDLGNLKFGLLLMQNETSYFTENYLTDEYFINKLRSQHLSECYILSGRVSVFIIQILRPDFQMHMYVARMESLRPSRVAFSIFTAHLNALSNAAMEEGFVLNSVIVLRMNSS
ncbi:hypothetical protein GLOIN_2v1474722 [Rhizophagus irregularis DAOM 181602=DAOM 197198]|uniref:Uncharacterized protein n=1 Tax=Rhizophagus irregularis (strain DAOM 181602 / DAOM 197198 / MUCL 43194) TaxID=747089 RepID=A0A2P4QFG4_RHIID|nr:hypothetical protein GLOIN_2v1474722 [Rhizophagus irregularis DAOM 181602=DAOM 197198]POG76357.1 hypothetical protein GLOIN_2v1474722 [Rhizophagus irregularis DAOM 181602=DAOM 197198]|eukprot:XP_025183223.1 hypothetical protein GLOIN_2v1474722 [Rhizophagus irregularis DAOM 181602=DAOM 197198]